MQRCPYIHEMRERLLGENNRETLQLESMERDNLIDNRHSSETNQVGTVVKVWALSNAFVQRIYPTCFSITFSIYI